MFNIGDKVVYPMHGAGVIQDIEEKNILGEKTAYYIIKMPGEVKVMVPTAKAEEIGMRNIIDGETASKVFQVLETDSTEMSLNWNKRYRDNMEKMKSGDIYEVADVVRNLSFKQKERGLSTGEKKMLLNAKQILVSELTLAENSNKDQMEELINTLKFDASGLIPAVVQNIETNEVLMVAYMNADTIKQTLETGRATFWSRSRQEVWVKGDTSGNYMYVKEVRVDCDCDCLVVLVNPAGPACHTGNRSCFFRKIEDGKLVEDAKEQTKTDVFAREQAVVMDRKEHPEEGSYTNYLFDKGEDKILKKVGEEAAEVVIAGKNRDKDEISYETADLIYHLTVMLVDNGMTWEDIYKEMERRSN